MWNDYYLKFADEAEYLAQMPEAWQTPATAEHAVDVIGTLYRNDTFEALPGFHVNLRLAEGVALAAGLEPFLLPPPALPKRVFA